MKLLTGDTIILESYEVNTMINDTFKGQEDFEIAYYFEVQNGHCFMCENVRGSEDYNALNDFNIWLKGLNNNISVRCLLTGLVAHGLLRNNVNYIIRCSW